MNARKGAVLASAGLGCLAAGLVLGTPIRGSGDSRVEALLRALNVMVVNTETSPVPVRQVADPAAARMPFVKWISVDLSKGEPIVTAHVFDVPAGQRVVLEYANVDECTPAEITQATSNLLVGYVDPATGQTRQQTLKLITQDQGVFPEADEPGAVYRHFGVSQPMSVYIDQKMPVDVWIYRNMAIPGHSEMRLWMAGYTVPVPVAGQ
jgi:hypothetical protein